MGNHVMYDCIAWFCVLCVACCQCRSKNMTSRFASLTEQDNEKIFEDKDSQNTKHKKVDEGGKGAVCWLCEREKENPRKRKSRQKLWKHVMSKGERNLVHLTPWGVWKPLDLAWTDILNQQEGLILLTSSNHRLESAGLNALEQLLFLKYWIGNREDGNTCLVLKAWQKIAVTFDSHQVKLAN